MKIVFRVDYHTVPGQSLWLKLTIAGDGNERGLPMRWINERKWQTEIKIEQAQDLQYVYQLRDESNGVVLDEWAGPRTVVADPARCDVLLLDDAWRSAGTVDYAFETAAFQVIQPANKKFVRLAVSSESNHLFCLRVAAVPAGMVPCVIGGVEGLGEWAWERALPMVETAANDWQVAVRLSASSKVEYKYGWFDLKRGCAVRLEEGSNRLLEPRFFSGQQLTVIHDEGFRRDASELIRAAGVAVPVFSLRSGDGLGVGEFADLKALADWAAGVGLKMIQILPINDTTSSHDWTDSYPYSAISVFALHPLYLRLDDLSWQMPATFAEAIDAAREWLNTMEHVDYEEVMKAKTALLREMFAVHRDAIVSHPQFSQFLSTHSDWVLPYAAFCVKRDQFGTADFSAWGEWAVFDRSRVDAMLDVSHADWSDVIYHIWLQWELDRQLRDAVDYLHQRGLALKGDLPIGIDRQSVDAWASPQWFNMDAQAGAPPDAFAVKGQNWGFPTYNWQAMMADGYAWWRSRFEKLSRYFDAYRIDHILGFFRIWQIPQNQVQGIMGWFDPAMPIHVDELRDRGIGFDFNRFCRPYIRGHFLLEMFGDTLDEVMDGYLDDCGHGYYQLRGHVDDQRKIVDHFAARAGAHPEMKARLEHMRDGLMECVSEVLLLEVPGSDGTLFHPRCSMQMTRSFAELDWESKGRFEECYVDYFFRRQEGYWQARGYEKLPAMRRASPMLLCGEDLGMVPACVPGVLRELGILSLEIQRMPKSSDVEFANPASAPYLSVVSSSTHDMPTLRGWWHEDRHVSGMFAWKMLGIAFPPAELSGDIATIIIAQHLQSPAMWAVFPIQDWLAIDEELRHSDADAERINVPAIMPYYWRYRMHLGLEELAAADALNAKILAMVQESGRTMKF